MSTSAYSIRIRAMSSAHLCAIASSAAESSRTGGFFGPLWAEDAALWGRFVLNAGSPYESARSAHCGSRAVFSLSSSISKRCARSRIRHARSSGGSETTRTEVILSGLFVTGFRPSAPPSSYSRARTSAVCPLSGYMRGLVRWLLQAGPLWFGVSSIFIWIYHETDLDPQQHREAVYRTFPQPA